MTEPTIVLPKTKEQQELDNHRLNIDWNNDIITQDEYRKARGTEPLPNGNRTSSEIHADAAKRSRL